MSEDDYKKQTEIHLPLPIEEVKEEYWYLEKKNFCTEGCEKQFNVSHSRKYDHNVSYLYTCLAAFRQ
jgi:hypothetical protein